MKTSRVLLGIAAGIAAGAILGILLAPDSGANTRKKIASKSQDVVDDLKGRFNHLVNGFADHAESLKEEATAQAERARNKVAETGRKTGQMQS
jgi:gas vesicle protein